mgnify:CR=1 FL=1
MDGYEINEIVTNHLYLGEKKLLSYKKIIQKSTYPSYNHSLSLETATDAIDAYAQSGGTLSNILELTVFFLECGTHFSGDFGGDIGEDFYTILEDTFEDMLKKLKSSGDKNLFDQYEPRIKSIIKAAHQSGWGYDDQLEVYWQEYFGK